MMETVDIPQIDANRLRIAFPDVLGSCRCFDVGFGWMMPVGQMCVALEKLPAGSVTVLKMTQKLGGLRVTLGEIALSEDQRSVVRHAKILAEERSRCICEACGQMGDIRRPPEGLPEAWVYCLCHRHLPRERRRWPMDRRKRRYKIGEVHWVYDDLLGRLLVDEKGNA
ncbi:hypothetical protein [Rhizobium skierniewicense]|uniref:hypothetical protein n=1 Tax=Rhizobium skierniewicense TaxID=984260 RepID=UPI001573C1B0|nr:hypothetical protein [Rhizobium skierniewicense]NTF31796.1 hypothetical protein [Rhizobium skierniewicense]